MDNKQQLKTADNIRRDTINILASLIEKGVAFGLPVAEYLGVYQEKLKENLYVVSVIGEAKKGKSAFINALIGKDILPEDVDVATCQVFCIQPSKYEEYHVFYEDGSRQEITRDDIFKYGSQTFIDNKEVPTPDKIIRWIEIKIPPHFPLLPNIHLLDTPGIGALYKSHEEITERFLPLSNAVIYTLDSTTVIDKSDLKLIKKILALTNNIFFIQSKIDLFDKKAWQEVKARNEEILKKEFNKQLKDFTIWPISSKLLRKAVRAEEDAQAFVMASRFEDMTTALKVFLFRVAGWERSAYALQDAGKYHTTSLNVLKKRKERQESESVQTLQNHKEKIAKLNLAFELSWGNQGKHRKDLLDKVNKIIVVGKQSIKDSLSVTGYIAKAEELKIDSLTTIEEANKVAEDLSKNILEVVKIQWNNTTADVRNSLMNILKEVNTDINELEWADDLSAEADSAQPFITDNWSKIRSVNLDYLTASTLGGVIAGAVGFPIVGVAIIAWALWKGWQTAGKNEVKTAQRELKQHLRNVLQQIQNHLFFASTQKQQFGQVEEFFENAKKDVLSAIDRLVTKKLNDNKAEIAQIDKELTLNGEQMKKEIEKTKIRLVEWENVGKEINSLVKKLTEFEN